MMGLQRRPGTAHFQHCTRPKLLPVNPRGVATDVERKFRCACGLEVTVTPLPDVQHAEEQAHGIAARRIEPRRR